MPEVRVISLIAVRLLALLFIFTGFWMLLGNLIETLPDFNPTYGMIYFKAQLLRPLLAIGVGFLIFAGSPILANVLSRGLGREG